jgi:hypothetical protein
VDDGEGWMEMIGSRNLTFHTYNQTVADEIVARIMGSYFELFEVFLARMTNQAQDGST